jgi:hypothetical protein
MQEPMSVADICAAMLQKYEVDEARCQQDILDLLARLQREGLVEVKSSANC